MSKLLERVKRGEESLTQQRLKEFLDYDPSTGFFTWKRNRGQGIAGGRAGSYTNGGYRLIRFDDRNYREHRLAWLWVHGKFPDQFIDHINGIKDDNRICNLRDVPNEVNQQNQKRAQATNRIGVRGGGFKPKKNRYEARISINNKAKYLGTFKTAEEAYAAYVEAKRIYHEGCTL